MHVKRFRPRTLASLLATIVCLFASPTIAGSTGGITEITLYHASGPVEISRSGGPFYTPTYRLTLRSDGCAFFSGGSPYLGPGDYTSSSFSYDGFAKLALAIESLGFFDLYPSYPRDKSVVLDADLVTISVKRDDEITTVTSPLYDGTPKAVDLLWRRIDDSGAGLVWVDDKSAHLAGTGGSKNDSDQTAVLARCHQ